MEESKTKIRILFAGGTIGGVVDSNTNSIKSSIIEEASLQKIPNASKLALTASWEEPKRVVTLLSEEMGPEDWTLIAEAIANEINNGKDVVDGIVVTHGTDTIPFTATAVAFMLTEAPIPIIFTGSNVPFCQPNSDAPQNLSDSILVATHRHIARAGGVYIVFPSKDGKSRDIHLAVRTQPISSYRHYLESVDLEPIGCVKNGKVSHRPKLRPYYSYSSYERRSVRVEAPMDPNIEYFRVYPGFNAARSLGKLASSDNDRIRAVLLELYHSGTGYTRKLPKEYNLAKYVSALHGEGILVFGLPRPETMYDTSLKLQRAGMTFLKKMSTPAAIIKLMLLLGQYQNDSEKIKEKMQENLRGELCET